MRMHNVLFVLGVFLVFIPLAAIPILKLFGAKDERINRTCFRLIIAGVACVAIGAAIG